MKKPVLATLSLLGALALPACQETADTQSDMAGVVDDTRTQVANTDNKPGKGKGKMVCKNGKFCMTDKYGDELCITPFVPCKETK